MTHVVIGAGQVGTAIAAVLRDVHEVVLRDIDEQLVESAQMIHICFPWSPAFDESVRGYQRAYGVAHTVIHSTVPVGTSRRLEAIHSPVTGRHPDLERSIRTFAKFVGGRPAAVVIETFKACGLRVIAVPDQETTEAGKLWQTLQYGWLIALEKEGVRFMRQAGADPAVAYRAMNEAYSAGYEALGLPFRLPVLEDCPGSIGGHCVIPNAAMTDAQLADWLIELDGTW